MIIHERVADDKRERRRRRTDKRTQSFYLRQFWTNFVQNSLNRRVLIINRTYMHKITSNISMRDEETTTRRWREKRNEWTISQRARVRKTEEKTHFSCSGGVYRYHRDIKERIGWNGTHEETTERNRSTVWERQETLAIVELKKSEDHLEWVSEVKWGVRTKVLKSAPPNHALPGLLQV